MTNLRIGGFRACFVFWAVILGACSSSSSSGNPGGQGGGGQAGSSTPAGTGGSVGSGGSIPSGSGGASATGGISGGGAYDAGYADVAAPGDSATGGTSGGDFLMPCQAYYNDWLAGGGCTACVQTAMSTLASCPAAPAGSPAGCTLANCEPKCGSTAASCGCIQACLGDCEAAVLAYYRCVNSKCASACGGVQDAGGSDVISSDVPVPTDTGVTGGSDAKSSDIPVPTDTGVAGGNLSVSGTYVTAGSLHGYSWARPFGAAPGTTVTPADTSNALCMTGTVGADPTLKTSVTLGFNLNEGGGGKGSVAAPSSITVVATVDTGSGGQGASIQLEPSVPAGSFAPAPPNYCVDAGDWTSGAAIPITSFNTGKCKNQTSSVDAGDPALAAGTQIQAISLVVQSAATAISFSVCLSGVTFN